MKKQITIYTDGASRGNPGPSGWAAVVFAHGYALEVAGAQKRATNNQMELEAVLQVLSDKGALKAIDPVVVYSDSAYVVNGLNRWVYGWEQKGWKTVNKTPVENKAVWEKLLKLLYIYGNRLTIAKVSGHSGELYNERCDELAVAYAIGEKPLLFKGTQEKYETFLHEIGTTKKKGKKNSKQKKSKKGVYSYVSLVGGSVFTDNTWAACEKRVKGKKGAKYKKVFSKQEETELVQDYTLSSLL